MQAEQKLALVENQLSLAELEVDQAAKSYSDKNWRGKWMPTDCLETAFKAGSDFYKSQLDAAIAVTKAEIEEAKQSNQT